MTRFSHRFARSPQLIGISVVLVIAAAVSVGGGLALALRNGGVAVDASPEVTSDASHAPSVEPSPTDDIRASASPSATPLPSQASPTSIPSSSASPTPTVVPTPTAVPTPTPTPVTGIEWPTGMRAITVVPDLTLRSAPEVSDISIIGPRIPNHTRLRLLEGPVSGSGYWWYRVRVPSIELGGGVAEGWVAAANQENTEPWIAPSRAACEDLPMPDEPATVETYRELFDGTVGTWVGCTSTRWMPAYPVTFTFRQDGTYSARNLLSTGRQMGSGSALYHGTDRELPGKTWGILDVESTFGWLGEIWVTHEAGNPTRSTLREIRLVGDRLEFNAWHLDRVGPVNVRLYRLLPSH